MLHVYHFFSQPIIAFLEYYYFFYFFIIDYNYRILGRGGLGLEWLGLGLGF